LGAVALYPLRWEAVGIPDPYKHAKQSIMYTTAEKRCGTIYFCMTFGAHKLVHSEQFLNYPYEIWHLLSALCSVVRKKIYINILYKCTSTVSVVNYCGGFFLLQILQLSTVYEVVRTIFSADCSTFRNF